MFFFFLAVIVTPSGAGPSDELPGGDLPPRGGARANRPGKEGSASVTVSSGAATQMGQIKTYKTN